MLKIAVLSLTTDCANRTERNRTELSTIPRKSTDAAELKSRFHPESNVGGFTFTDASIAFFSQIDAILRPSDRVLDFGAGRGQHILDDTIDYRRKLSNLHGRCAHVEGCDVDDAVLTNPFLDNAEVVEQGAPLPYPDDSFDLVISRFVFEHIDNPEFAAQELVRVVKPGGIIAALTPNKRGYIAMAASLVPNRLHVQTLKYAQPKRKSEDVFPTVYRLNTNGALRRAFGPGVDIFTVYLTGGPAYFFGRPLLYRANKCALKYLPDRLRPLLAIYIRKH